jgi:transposase InsO family protein
MPHGTRRRSTASGRGFGDVFGTRPTRTTSCQSPNLLQQDFTATAPNQAWVGDITYIWTAEGWAYLAVLLDLYSRRVVGWALWKSLSRAIAIAALEHALTCRRPTPRARPSHRPR